MRLRLSWLPLHYRLLPIFLVVGVWIPLKVYLHYEKAIWSVPAQVMERVEWERAQLPVQRPASERTFWQVVEETAQLARYEGEDKCGDPRTGGYWYRGVGRDVVEDIEDIKAAYLFFEGLEELTNEEKRTFEKEIRKNWDILEYQFHGFQVADAQ